MEKSFQKEGQLLFFPGCEPGKVDEQKADMETVSEVDEIRRILSAKMRPRDKVLYEERHAIEFQLGEVFESALEKLKEADSQSRVDVYFLHPSTQSRDFGRRLYEFLRVPNADYRVRKEVGRHGRLIYVGCPFHINGQEIYGYAVENYYYF